MDDKASLSSKVRHLVLTLLPFGQCTLSQIARHVGVDERTVRRGLAKEGTSYNDLLNETRRELAPRYLSGARRKHAEIALLLGFSGPTVFSRWFRDQFGCSAAAWTAAAHAPHAPHAPNPTGVPKV